MLISHNAVKFALQEHLVFRALVFHAASRETNLDLQAKSLKGEDENELQRYLRKLQFGGCFMF